MDQTPQPSSPLAALVAVLGLTRVGRDQATSVLPSETTKRGRSGRAKTRPLYLLVPLLSCLIVGIGCAKGGPLQDTEDDPPSSPTPGSDVDGGRSRPPGPATASSPSPSSPTPSTSSTSGSERDAQTDSSITDGSSVPDAAIADARPDTSAAFDGGPCAHPTTSTGGPLSATCSPCAAAVCATNPSCCTIAWDTTCLIQQALNAACRP